MLSVNATVRLRAVRDAMGAEDAQALNGEPDARLRHLIRVARSCVELDDAHAAGLTREGRARALDFLDRGCGDALVLRVRWKMRKKTDDSDASSALADATNARARDKDVEGHWGRCAHAKVELDVEGGERDPVLFVVRPDTSNGSSEIGLNALRSAMHGYYPHGACLEELHATLRHSFVSAFESSEVGKNRSFAKHVREFVHRVSADASSVAHIPRIGNIDARVSGTLETSIQRRQRRTKNLCDNSSRRYRIGAE